MDRVELIIQLTGDKEALSSLQNIKRNMDALKNSKVQIQIDKLQLDREIADVRKQLRDLTSQKTVLEFKNTNLREIGNEIKLASDQLAKLRHERDILSHSGLGPFAAGRISELTSQIDTVKSHLLDLTRQKHALEIGDENIVRVREQIQETAERLKDLLERRGELGFDVRGIDIALSQLSTFQKELEGTKSRAEQLADALGKIGSALSSAGNFFTGISGMFDSNIVDTMERYATVMATRMFAQNWGAATERFDILSTYADYLEIVGVTAEESSASLDKINAKIQGLPVGLSDVAYQTRMYQMYLNDMERATNLAIGLNRSLIAGGANEQMRNTAKYEIDRLLATGTLNTSRQWRALIQGLGVSGRFLREEMGYGDMSQNEFIDRLFKKEISGDEFIRGIEKMADSGKLNEALDIYKTTIESGLSNIYFALTRGKANILAALDESLTEGTGKNISGWLYEIRDGINEVYKSAAGWIRENPEMLEAGIDKILAIFERLAAFDWGGLITKIGTGVGQYLDILMKLYDAINAVSPDAFEDFITFAMVWAGPIGTSLRLLASACNVLSGALNGLGPAMKWLKEFAALNPAVIQNIGLYGGAAAAFGLMMAGYAKEAKNASYALRDYKNALDEVNSVGAFDNRLSMSYEAGDLEGMDEQLEALKKYRGEQERILFDLLDYREEMESMGPIDFSDDELTGKMSDEATTIAELNAKIQWHQELVNGATLSYDEWIAKYDALKKAKEAAAMAEAFPDKLPDIPEEQLQKLTQLVTKWSELREETQKTIDKQLEGFAKIEEAATVDIGTLTENLQSQVNALTNLSENLASIDEIAASKGGAYGEALAQIAGEIAGMGLDGAGFAQGLNKALTHAVENEDWTAVDALVNTWVQKLDAEDAAADMTAFAEMFAQNFYEALEVAFENLEGFGSVADLIFGNMEEGGALDAIEGIAEKLEGIRENLGEEGLTGDVTVLNDATTALSEETLPITVENMDLLTESVMRLMNEGLIPATAATQDLTQAILELIAALERLFNLIQSKLGVLQQFTAHLREVAAAAREATQAVNELAAAIDALHDKTVTITVNVVGGEGLGGIGGGFNTGGLVDKSAKAKYYDSGGSVFGTLFKPRGTDTVPAMLTPGEYVMRRGAVDQLGAPFLQRLNRLDIAGALDNLMHRFYRPSQAAYSVVNNSSDNRAYTVTQNIYTENPDYTYRVAARFAHAL